MKNFSERVLKQDLGPASAESASSEAAVEWDGSLGLVGVVVRRRHGDGMA